jgi:hypothetical protein
MSGIRFGSQIFELVGAGLLEGFDEGSEGGRQELKRIFEDQVLAPEEGKVFFEAQWDDEELFLKVAQHLDYEMTVIALEVVENDRDFVGLPQFQVAVLMCDAAKLSGDVTVIANLKQRTQR